MIKILYLIYQKSEMRVWILKTTYVLKSLKSWTIKQKIKKLDYKIKYWEHQDQV